MLHIINILPIFVENTQHLKHEIEKTHTVS